MSSPSGSRRLAVALAALVLAVSGCSSDPDVEQATDDPTPSASASESESSAPESAAPEAAACSEVWVEGATIPRDYQGCDEDGSFVAADSLGCSSGQEMVRYADHFFGVLGGKVRQTEAVLDEDVGYRDAVASCRG